MKNKILSCLSALVLFLLIFSFIHILHFRIFQVEVVLYSTVVDLALALTVLACLTTFTAIGKSLSVLEITLLYFNLALIGSLFAVMGPTVIDRSLSIYILEKIDQRGGGIKQSAFAEIFRIEYMKEHRLVDVRLTEQFRTGSARLDGQCVRITPLGRLIVSFTQFYRRNLLPKRRVLLGSETDALTDPFRHSSVESNYRC
ncbi:MAG: hypothetical protein AAF732_01755 [Pseudomonadota bacterium]